VTLQSGISEVFLLEWHSTPIVRRRSGERTTACMSLGDATPQQGGELGGWLSASGSRPADVYLDAVRVADLHRRPHLQRLEEQAVQAAARLRFRVPLPPLQALCAGASRCLFITVYMMIISGMVRRSMQQLCWTLRCGRGVARQVCSPAKAVMYCRHSSPIRAGARSASCASRRPTLCQHLLCGKHTGGAATVLVRVRAHPITLLDVMR
jgi:hypothetical protein